jgi:hypothetical protein
VKPPDDAGLVQTFEYQAPKPDSGYCVAYQLTEAPYCDDRSCCRPTVQ